MDEIIITDYFYKLFLKEVFYLRRIKVEDLFLKVPNFVSAESQKIDEESV